MGCAGGLRCGQNPGVSNPADAPSRGAPLALAEDWTFLHHESFNNPPASIDCCAHYNGSNAIPGCSTFFSTADPAWNNIEALVGQTLWAAPPFDIRRKQPLLRLVHRFPAGQRLFK